MLEQDKRNHEAYIKSGEIFEDRQHAYERMTRAVERLTVGVQQLSDLLGLTPPTLPTAASLSKSALQIVETTSSFTVHDDGPIEGGIWDDEEEKRFYEDLPDLKDLVPASLLGIKGKRTRLTTDESKVSVEAGSSEGEQMAQSAVADNVEAQKRDEEDIRRQLEQMELVQEQLDETIDLARTTSNSTVASPRPQSPAAPSEDLVEQTLTTNMAAPNEDGLPSAPAARLTALFAALPEANNREMVDKLAVEFAFLNSKAARNRLIKVRIL